jgi:hypothetical protein
VTFDSGEIERLCEERDKSEAKVDLRLAAVV